MSTHTRETKSGTRKTVVTTEHNPVKVADVKTMSELRADFIGDPELMILSEILVLNTTLSLVQLKRNKVGDDGAIALAGAIATAKLPVRAVRLEGNLVSADGAEALIEGLLKGGSPLEELTILDNPVTQTRGAVAKQKVEQEREAALKVAANVSRSSPASEWAKVQLQVRATVAERRQQGMTATALTDADFDSVLKLPKELREDRWVALGGLYGAAPTATAEDGVTPPPSQELTEAMQLPQPKHLAKLTPPQLRQLWEMAGAPVDASESEYRPTAIQAICKLLGTRGNRCHIPIPLLNCALPTTHCSLPTIHYSLLTAHYSPFTTHYPLLTTHHSLLTAHCSLLTIHYSLPTAHYSPFTTHYPLLTTHHSPLTTHYPLLTTHHPLLTIHYSLPTTHYSPPTTHYLALTTHRTHY